jgi:hypothetical protein
MELQQLTDMILQANKRINEIRQNIYSQVQTKAQAEREYRTALGQEKLKLKSEGMNITLIDDIAKSNVSELKFKRDVAEDLFKASIESLKALQAELSGLQTIARYQKDI